LGVGVVNGLVLGLLLGIGAYLVTGSSGVAIGLIVAAATVANTILAVVAGGMMPMVMRRLKIDPAVASTPILTMITDTCGFLFVLGLAAVVLR
jgi:magnesium transporter